MTAEDISTSATQKQILLKLSRSTTCQASIVQRAKIILLKSEGHSAYYIVKSLRVTWMTVRKWLCRWRDYEPKFLEKSNASNMQSMIIDCLTDSCRSGRPPRFTPEEKMHIIKLACTQPKTLGLPFTHWSTRSLAAEAKRRNIVNEISHDRVAVFLKSSGTKTS
jgi:transposase